MDVSPERIKLIWPLHIALARWNLMDFSHLNRAELPSNKNVNSGVNHSRRECVSPRCARALSDVLACLVASTVLVLPASAVGTPRCADMFVDADDLNEILDQTLGSLRGLVDRRSVVIDVANPACYLRISLSSSALGQSGSACRLDGCSSVVVDRHMVALRDFDVAGCDVVFDGLGLSRHVPLHYTDASARIRQHCGSPDFDISEIRIDRHAPVPRLIFSFRPAAAGR